MRLSFSAVEIYDWCPYQFKLRYIDKIILDRGNIYSGYGKAVHSTLEKHLIDPKVEINDYFKYCFKKELKKLPYNKKKELFTDKEMAKLLKDMMRSGARLCQQAVEKLEEKFQKYTLFGLEIRFDEPLTDYEGQKDFEFSGTIDIIIQDQDGIYHILDFKTSTWGWEAKKKTEKMRTYQLTYYKHFFSLQTDTDLDKIKTHFALIKRTAKKDNIEIFEVPVGKQKIKNALKVLNNMMYNIENNRFVKNKTDCRWCPYHFTEYCDAK